METESIKFLLCLIIGLPLNYLAIRIITKKIAKKITNSMELACYLTTGSIIAIGIGLAIAAITIVIIEKIMGA